ncbi:MAG: tetratricopeptide repeat protein [Candidatus Omnitrophota bacterium]|nr:tetratricopeptide repeat protein [Candidatus Omnitrophota bacterium]
MGRRIVMLLMSAALFSGTPGLLAEPAENPASEAPAADIPNEGAITDRLDFANGLFSRGMYDMSAAEYESLAQEYPDHPQIALALIRRAESLFLLNRFEESVPVFNEFIQKFPDDSNTERARQRVAEAFYHSQKFDEAEEVLNGLAAGGSNAAQRIAHYYLGRILFDRGTLPEAEGHFEKASGGGAENPFFYLAHFYSGEIMVATERVEEAVREFKVVAESDKEDLRQLAYFGLGKAAFVAGDLETAIANFKRAHEIELSPGIREDALINRIKSLYNLGRFPEILEIADSGGALVGDPKKIVEYKSIVANSYSQVGAFEDANAVFGELLEDPFSTAEEKKRAGLQMSENLFNLERPTEALVVLNRWPVTDTHLKDRWLYLRSEALKRTGLYQEAIDALDQLVLEFPESELIARAYLSRGYVFIEFEKFSEAETALGEFVERFPEHDRAPKALSDKILVQIKLEQWQPATRDAEMFLEKYAGAPQSRDVYHRLGSLYSETGNYAAAHEIYAKYLERPDTTEEHSSVSFLMGYNKQMAGELAAAVTLYKQVEKDKVTGEVFYAALKNSAFCLISLEQYAEAVAYYSKIIAEFPENDLSGEVYSWLAFYYVEHGDTAALRKALEQFQGKPEGAAQKNEIEFYWGELNRLEGNCSEALLHYDASVVGDGFFETNASLGKGLCAVDGGDLDTAVTHLEKAIKGAHQDYALAVRARTELAKALRVQEKYLEAAKAFMAVAILYEDKDKVPQALLDAGDSFEKAGRMDDARRAFSELVSNHEGHELVEEARGRLERLPHEE